MDNTEETLHKFPCDFMLKAFGLDTVEFETEVLSIIRKHAPNEVRENSFTYRKSQDKKYLSITIRLNIQSKTQLDAIYRDLTSSPQVLMAL